MPPIIISKNLTKTFGSITALDDCNLNVQPGEVFGLLGPNGAGKSTWIRLLLGFLNPTSGSATVAGFDCHRQRNSVHEIVSYLPGDARLFRMMRGRGVLELFSQFRAGAGSDGRLKSGLKSGLEIANRLELDLDRWVGLMSTGMRQKLAITICLATETPLLILDEPTANLDPTVRGQVMELVLEAKNAGRTVVFSSHVLSEIEDVCDRVGILRAGKLVHLAAMSEIRMQHRIKAHLNGSLPPLPDELQSVVSVQQTENSVQIETPGELSRVLKWLAEAPLADMHVQPIGLRSVYDRFHSGDVEQDSLTTGEEPAAPASTLRESR